MTSRPSHADVVRARRRIAPFIHRTPVTTCSALDEMAGSRLFLKCENLQKVGAFKIRGACNAVLALRERGYRGPVATHSSGNHGAALALAARLQAMPALVVMPENSSRVKLDAVRGYGARVTTCTTAPGERDRVLDTVILETGARVVHPYDDADVIAGQGTAVLELIEDAGDLDLIMTPIGGGGLISGTAIAARALLPGVRLIGVEPAGAAAFESMRAGALVESGPPETMADGLRAPPAQSTFDIIRDLVDEIVTVSEPGIVEAMRTVWQRTKLVIEPSSAVVVAALLEGKVAARGLRTGVVLTGGNVDLDALPW